MVEWFIASVLKTEEVKASGGSNPSLSVLCANGGIGRRTSLRSWRLHGVGVQVPLGALFATIAQLVEHAICNRAVVGSNPTCGSDASIAQW